MNGNLPQSRIGRPGAWGCALALKVLVACSGPAANQKLVTDVRPSDPAQTAPGVTASLASSGVGEVLSAPFTLVGELTGAALRGALSGLLGDIQARAQILGDNLTTKLKNDVQVTISQLDAVLGDKLKAPVAELNETMRLVVDRASVVMVQTERALNATLSCTATDARLVATQVTSQFDAVVSSAAFWTGQQQFVAATYALSENSRMGMYVNRPPTALRMYGSFPDLSAQKCGNPTVIVQPVGGQPAAARVLAADHRSIVAEFPSMTQAGVHPVRIAYREIGFFGRCAKKATEVMSFLVVAPEPVFQFEYSAAPECGVFAAQTKEVFKWIPNHGCSGDKQLDLALCADPGWEYLSGSVSWEGCNGDHSRSAARENNCYRATSTIPEKGGFLCTGPNKSSGARVLLTQRRLEPTPASKSLTGKFDDARYQSTIRHVVFDPSKPPKLGDESPSQCRWTVSVSATKPGGATVAVPAWTGKGLGTSAAADGTLFSWNPYDGSLTVSTPPYVCEYLF